MIKFNLTHPKMTSVEKLNVKAMDIYRKYEDAKKSYHFAQEVLHKLQFLESNEANNKASRYFLDEVSENELKMTKLLKEYNDFCRVNNLD
jgi:hypothetical protein